METVEEKKMLAERVMELKRQKYATDVESKCLKLDVGSSKRFELFDYQAFYNIKARFWRLKSRTGMVYKTEIKGNDVIVTRVIENGDNVEGDGVENNDENGNK